MSTDPRGPGLPERELIEAARGGDEDAYRRLVEPHRGELHAHCYRMLGSVHDAEDALQETLLRAWRGLPRFEGRSSLRSWLYRIATNACLDAIARRPKRVLPVDYGPAADPRRRSRDEPLVESVWIEPYPDETLGLEDGYAAPEARYEQRESVELAFVAALQHLPRQPARRADPARGARLLRPRGRGVARDDDRVGQQRAAARAQGGRRAAPRAEPAGHAARARRRAACARSSSATSTRWSSGDVDAVLAMLTEDATLVDAARCRPGTAATTRSPASCARGR